MNEPAVLVPNRARLPPDTAHHGDGEAKLHIQVHNMFGQLMARATCEALTDQRPERRLFVISRAGFAGIQAVGTPLDWRQLVVVGAPADEHAAIAEPWSLGLRLACYACAVVARDGP